MLGGTRSGKSTFAEALVSDCAESGVRYIAPAPVMQGDVEHADRVAVHQDRRPEGWTLVEGDPVPALVSATPVTLIDDVGAWLTARMDQRDAWTQGADAVADDVAELVAAVSAYQQRLILVSPEVGLGVVPATRSGRLFQDELGALNQRLARVCDEVYFVVAGVATRLDRVDAARPAVAVPAATDSAAKPPAAAQVPTAADPIYSPRPLPVFGPVDPPDAQVRTQARQRQAQLTKPAGALGLLEELGNWAAACQGVCPPRQFQQVRVVVVAGDHGIAREGVSAYPTEVTAQMVANLISGGAAVNVLARLADATVRVVDIAVDADTDPCVSTHKVCRGSQPIDRADALTETEVAAALSAGAAIADEEIDSGADLLIAGDMGIGNTTPATVLIATVTDTEPVLAVGRGTGIDDAGWMRKTAAVRDAMWRAHKHSRDAVALLRIAGGADLAALAGFLATAAKRRTPVILDGMVVTAAALMAQLLAPGAKAWWLAGHRSAEPSHTRALTELGLPPLLELNMRLGEGSGAVTALPLLRAAVGTLADMATFSDAGVSTAV